MGDFNKATSVTALEPGIYETEIDGTWSVNQVPNGGYLLASMLRATTAESSHPHPIATSAHFMMPPSPGPATVVVEPYRVGRTTSTLHATLRQEDRPLVDLTVTMGALDARSVPEWSGPSPEPVAHIDDCVEANVDLPDGTHVSLLEHVEVRLDPQTLGWFSGHPAGQLAMRGHVRLADGTQPDPYVLALAVDALPPTVFGLGRLGWAPTVQLSLLTRALPAAGWLTVHLRGRLVRDDWFDEEAEVYDANGDLVAQSRQIARVRVT
ncbi:MAG TPA: thioesterase family protein [Jiangellaceae bacterium]